MKSCSGLQTSTARRHGGMSFPRSLPHPAFSRPPAHTFIISACPGSFHLTINQRALASVQLKNSLFLRGLKMSQVRQRSKLPILGLSGFLSPFQPQASSDARETQRQPAEAPGKTPVCTVTGGRGQGGNDTGSGPPEPGDWALGDLGAVGSSLGSWASALTQWPV